MVSAQDAIFWLWDGWFASWMLAALWASRAVRWPNLLSQALHWTIFCAGMFLLLVLRSRVPRAPGRLWDVAEPVGWTLLGLTAIGLAFTWYARVHLGRLWSGSVTRKADHRIIDTGPYALVRHPIYTGLIGAALATGLLRGTVAAISGAALVALGLWLKARLEERFLRRELGEEAYDGYSRRTPMLVPFLVGRAAS